MMRPYTRSLDLQDYRFLAHAHPLRRFEAKMTAPHVLWHEHKIWENASIMQQLEELDVPKDAKIIDIGSGGTFFPCYLATVGGYPNVSLTDSMFAKDITHDVQAQRLHYGVELPLFAVPAEDMGPRPEIGWDGADNSFDVTMCISTIEHIVAGSHDQALRELWRITRPGGLIFITSDYFRSNEGGVDQAQYAASPYRDGQHTPYHKELVLNLPDVIDAEFVGETDLDYRGDFVHNYSFVNICLRKAS